MLAAWLVVQGGKRETQGDRKAFFLFRSQNLLAILGILVLFLTAGWAFAFTSIYTRDEPRIAASKWIYENVPAPLNLHLTLPDGSLDKEPLPFYSGVTVQQEVPYRTVFLARQDGVLNSVSFAHLEDLSASGTQTLTLVVATASDPTREEILATATRRFDFKDGQDYGGDSFSLSFVPPLAVREGQTYFLILETTGGSLAISGSGVINETDYDWTLPFRIDGYDGFGGLFRGDLNLQIYWSDDADKLERYLSTLNDGDFIFIPTNHQYAQTTRIPERYPLTTAYYRALVGCPDESGYYSVLSPGRAGNVCRAVGL